MQVLVRDNNVDQALRALTKKNDVLLIVVPEPTSAALLLAGLLPAFIRRRRS